MALKKYFKFARKERKRENKVLIYIYFETKRLVVIFITNSEICLSKQIGVLINNKNRYKHELNKHKIEI